MALYRRRLDQQRRQRRHSFFAHWVSIRVVLPTPKNFSIFQIFYTITAHNATIPTMKTTITITIPISSAKLLGHNASDAVRKLINAPLDPKALKDIKEHLTTRRTSCTLNQAAANKLAALEKELNEPATAIVRALVELAVARHNNTTEENQ